MLDVHKERSHSVQCLVQRGLEELICGCFYEDGALSGPQRKMAQQCIGSDDP